MITEAETRISNNPAEKDLINDLCSGLFNMIFCIGAIAGPLLGNLGFVELGAEDTCEYTGYFVIGFGIFYFLMCDDLFYKKKALPMFVDDESSPLIENLSIKKTVIENELEISQMSLKRIKF